MGIKQLYNDNLRKLPNEYGDVSVMNSSCEYFDKMLNDVLDKIINWLMKKESFWHDLNPIP